MNIEENTIRDFLEWADNSSGFYSMATTVLIYVTLILAFIFFLLLVSGVIYLVVVTFISSWVLGVLALFMFFVAPPLLVLIYGYMKRHQH